MGLLGRIRRRLRRGDRPSRQFSGVQVTGALAALVDATISGQTAPVDRATALSVPAMLRGRNLICSIATLPLVQHGPDGSIVRSPFLEQIDPDVPNVVTLAQTIEDLLFDGIAWWRVLAYDQTNLRPVRARRVDPSAVSLRPPSGRRAPLPSGQDPRDAMVWVDGRPVPAGEMIRFDSPNPPVLTAAARSIRRAILLERLASVFARNPRPLDYFEPADFVDEDPDDEDIKEFLSQWQAYRLRNSTGYVPRGFKYQSVSQPSPAELQLVELQARAALDIANALGVDPEELGVSTTSRTYANVVDRRRDKINDVLSPYMLAVTQRLSMGDVTVRGYSVQFDLDNYLKSNPTERWSAHRAALELRVATREEVRQREGWGPMPDELRNEVEEPEVSSDTQPDEEQAEQPAGAEAAARPTHALNGVRRHNFRRDGLTQFRGPENGSYDFIFEDARFTFDAEKRTVEGLALPYGKQASKYGYKFRFDKGSLQFSDVSRVKITMDHWDAVGVATYVSSKADGYHARGRIARGAKGDELLALAEDGVYDGMSVGVLFDFDQDTVPDPKFKDDPAARLVKRATLLEIAITALPAFDDARLTSVKANQSDEGNIMECATCGQRHVPGVACPSNAVTVQASDTPAAPAPEPTPTPTPEPASAGFSVDQVMALFRAVNVTPPAAPASMEAPTFVDPTSRPVPGVSQTQRVTVSREPIPYRFDRRGNFAGVPELGDHDFAQDLIAMQAANDLYGRTTDAGRRVMALLQRRLGPARFADVETDDANELIPAIQREFLDTEPPYTTPLWNMIFKGAPPNGVQPFTFPKFSSASGLVADHVEKTEPTGGTFVTTGQTITPTPLSGKVSITREIWDATAQLGSNALSTLIWNKMLQAWDEELETSTADFLSTLTSAEKIEIDAAAVDTELGDEIDAMIAELNFIRGYSFTGFAVEKILYMALVNARDLSGGQGTGRKLYPQFAPVNASGVAQPRYRTLDLGGITAVPAWALRANPTVPNYSYLFDPAVIWGWATAPERLEFAGSGGSTNYQPVAFLDLAIWGYKAHACTDINGVRRVRYDEESG